jgi:hypothetical protein
VAGDDLLRQIQFIDNLFDLDDRRSAMNLSAFETCNTTRQKVGEEVRAAIKCIGGVQP